MDDGSPTVEAVFTLIEHAARLIAIAQPAVHAQRIRDGIDRSFYVDPTLANLYLVRRDDMDRKLRILDDAARLVSNWDVIALPEDLSRG